MKHKKTNLIKGLILSSALSLVAFCQPVSANEQVQEVQVEQAAAKDAVAQNDASMGDEQASSAEETTDPRVAAAEESLEAEEVAAEGEVAQSEDAVQVEEVAVEDQVAVAEEAAQVEEQVAAVEETAIEELVAVGGESQLSPEEIWQEFHSVPGKCSLNFPTYPEHISEKMSLADEGYDLIYDAYISPMDKQTVFMLLVAQYPEFVDESYAQMSLEGFLNGILNHNPGNQLIFADLVLVDGHSGLDFFIRTGNVYFKGRAIMVKNNLYLMAMECAIPNYDEGKYNQFVNSFQLSK